MSVVVHCDTCGHQEPLPADYNGHRVLDPPPAGWSHTRDGRHFCADCTAARHLSILEISAAAGR